MEKKEIAFFLEYRIEKIFLIVDKKKCVEKFKLYTKKFSLMGCDLMWWKMAEKLVEKEQMEFLKQKFLQNYFSLFLKKQSGMIIKIIKKFFEIKTEIE